MILALTTLAVLLSLSTALLTAAVVHLWHRPDRTTAAALRRVAMVEVDMEKLAAQVRSMVGLVHRKKDVPSERAPPPPPSAAQLNSFATAAGPVADLVAFQNAPPAQP